jgi:hypothetical protein
LARGAAVAAALLLATSACGGDDESPIKLGKQSESTSVSPTASPGAIAPTLPRATNDKAGREAFARYFVQAYAYAFATNDAGPVTDIGATEKSVVCSMCAKLVDYTKKNDADGLTLKPSRFPVVKVFDQGEVQNGVFVVDVISNRPAYSVVDESGRATKRFPAKKGYLIEVGMRFRDGAYELTGWRAGEQ